MESKKIKFNVALCLLSTLAFLTAPAAMAAKPSYDSKMALAATLQFNGNTEQAIKAYKFAIALKPGAFDPHKALVGLYMQIQDFKNASDECREALKIKANDKELQNLVLQLLLAQQDFNGAADVLKERIKDSPNNKDLHMALGNLYRNQVGATADADEKKKYLAQATSEFETAEKLGVETSLVHTTLAVMHLGGGDFDKAMEHVNIALKEKDELPDAHLIKGVLQFRKGAKDEALKEMDIAIKQKGKNAEARNTKADILYGDGKVDEAIAEYKRAQGDDPNSTQAMVGLANIYEQQQKWEDALAQLEKAQQIQAKDANILYSMAICLEKMGKVDAAVPKFVDGMNVDTNQAQKGQIAQHVQELQGRSFGGVPGLMTPGSSGLGPTMSGSGLFGNGPSFLTQPASQLIQLKPGESSK